MPVGRFAPSPTGPLHLGNLRTALIAYLCARRDHAAFLMRVEDLDVAASRSEIEQQQLSDLRALGLEWDEPIVRQSERREAHKAAITVLQQRGLLYECYCTRREIQQAASAPHGDLPEGAYPGTCRDLHEAATRERQHAGRPPALRLRVDGEQRSFDDLLHGRVAGVCDDFVVRRNDGVPAYNLAVVVDDAAMGVEEVVRGDDLLSTTPRQVLLGELLGLPIPTYVHVPLVVGADGERLAKRHGAVTLTDLAAAGRDATWACRWIVHSLGIAGVDDDAPLEDLAHSFDPLALPREAIVWDDAGAVGSVRR